MNNKQSLLATLQQSRERVLELLNSLSAQQTKVPYLPGINPPIWEVGHAAFFFERFILQNLDKAPSYNPALDDQSRAALKAAAAQYTPSLHLDL